MYFFLCVFINKRQQDNINLEGEKKNLRRYNLVIGICQEMPPDVRRGGRKWVVP